MLSRLQLVAALAAIALWAFTLKLSYQEGHVNGVTAAEAKANKTTIATLTEGIQQYRDGAKALGELVTASKHVSQLVRQSADDAAQYNRSNINELRDLLAATAGERADCRFDDGSMQQLGAARDRAAAAARGATPSGAAAGLRAAPNDTRSGG